MKAWRVAKERFAALDGDGARLHGGRWNSPGRPLIYAAAHLSLALIEMLVRLPTGEVPDDYVQIEIAIPDDIPTETMIRSDLPGGSAHLSRAYGDAWLEEGRTAILLVPAITVLQEFNVLINPLHPHGRRIIHATPEPVVWDRRLFRS